MVNGELFVVNSSILIAEGKFVLNNDGDLFVVNSFGDELLV
jgi:hypothetical protein